MAFNIWVVKLSSAHLQKVLPRMRDCFEARFIVMVNQNLERKLELTRQKPNEGDDIQWCLLRCPTFPSPSLSEPMGLGEQRA